MLWLCASLRAQPYEPGDRDTMDMLLNLAAAVGILGLSAVLTGLFTRKMYTRCPHCGTLNAKRRTECRACGQGLP